MICNNSPIVFSEYLLKKLAVVRPSALDPIILNSVPAALAKGMLKRTALDLSNNKKPNKKSKAQ